MTSQILSFIHVYLSNAAYQDTLSAITGAGYLAVPNQMAAMNLATFQAAWNGGLFFTFTTGLCLTVLSSLLAWMFLKLPVKKYFSLLLPISVWVFVLVNANLDGFSSLAFFQLFIIPPLIFILSIKVFSSGNRDEPETPVSLHMAVFAAFAVFSATISDMNIFLDIRDNLLLNSQIGRRINSFYYDNSLYSARVFKSTGQRLLKTCSLGSLPDNTLSRRLTARLLHHDYIPVVEKKTPYDLSIIARGSDLDLMKENRVVVTVPINDFLKRYAAVLKDYEKKTDCHGFFRKFTMLSLLFNGVLILFLIVYLPFYMLLKRYIRPMNASIASGLFCLLGNWLFFTMLGTTAYSVNDENLKEALSSPDVNYRITALKYINQRQLKYDVLSFYPDISIKENIAERYWFAKSLRYGRGSDVRGTLRTLLDDPHFNVVCMAFHSLGYAGNRKDIRVIIEEMKQSDNWYEQWYAYKALRRLGWKQKKSG